MKLLIVYVLLLGTHYGADFIMQTHWQAVNKSKNLGALGWHIATYSMVMLAAAVVLIGPYSGIGAAIGFALFTGFLHFATDYFTSKWSAALYEKGDWHNFFIVIGADQLMHQIALALTLLAFLKP